MKLFIDSTWFLSSFTWYRHWTNFTSVSFQLSIAFRLVVVVMHFFRCRLADVFSAMICENKYKGFALFRRFLSLIWSMTISGSALVTRLIDPFTLSLSLLRESTTFRLAETLNAKTHLRWTLNSPWIGIKSQWRAPLGYQLYWLLKGVNHRRSRSS